LLPPTLTHTFDRIVDENDNTIREEAAFGDIIVKCPAPMLGYLDNDKATLEALEGDNWVRTGDVGQLVDGKVFVVDRKKDLIKVRGWQVSPAEVESVILQHPDVLDVAVIGVEPENNSGEVPRAYIVNRPESKLGLTELKAFAGKSLAKYKLPEEIIFVERIPKNSTGKILRRLLREEKATGITVEVLETLPEDTKQRTAWHYLTFLSAKTFIASMSFSWLAALFRYL
jgi:acyl-CoA synthetase (AMP-forming)/AMP-acid ligase II